MDDQECPPIGLVTKDAQEPFGRAQLLPSWRAARGHQRTACRAARWQAEGDQSEGLACD